MPKKIVGVERAADGKPLLEPRLWGTWRSDRKKTFERIRFSGKPQQLQKLRSLFGKLTVTWKRSTMSTYFDGKWWPSQVPMDPTPTLCHYTVLARSAERVVVLVREDMTRREKGQSVLPGEDMLFIDFDASGYWLTVNSGFCEYFKKLTPKAKPGRGKK